MKPFLGLELDFADPSSMFSPETSALKFLAADLEANHEARDRELDEMIAMGWGDVDQDKIPPDWRTRPGPERRAQMQRHFLVVGSEVGSIGQWAKRLGISANGLRHRINRGLTGKDLLAPGKIHFMLDKKGSCLQNLLGSLENE
jgi:hypothetical protein